MGCLDKIGGTIIALLIIILGCKYASGEFILVPIVGGIAFGILTFIIDSDDFISFAGEFTDIPLLGLFKKFFLTAIISGLIMFGLAFFLYYLRS